MYSMIRDREYNWRDIINIHTNKKKRKEEMSGEKKLKLKNWNDLLLLLSRRFFSFLNLKF